MYVIDIHYHASLERIDDALERHRAYLQPLFERGIFIAAGPKVPREGGNPWLERSDSRRGRRELAHRGRDRIAPLFRVEPGVVA